MSSHREAPEISKDPVADNTDVYAFVSPDDSGTVTLIANYIPLEGPAGGPNFFEFGDDVLYEIPSIMTAMQSTTSSTNSASRPHCKILTPFCTTQDRLVPWMIRIGISANSIR
jgi:hypothetical protein